jgi:hypothetical protein
MPFMVAQRVAETGRRFINFFYKSELIVIGDSFGSLRSLHQQEYSL